MECCLYYLYGKVKEVSISYGCLGLHKKTVSFQYINRQQESDRQQTRGIILWS